MDKSCIHPDFARWYSEVDLEHDDARLLARWEGLCDLLEEPFDELADLLLNLVLGFETAPADSPVRVPFLANDQYFIATDNNREMVVLSEVALILMSDPNGDYAEKETVAQKIEAALMPHRSDHNFATDLPDKIGVFVHLLGEKERRRIDLTTPKVIASIDISKEVAAVEANNFEQLKGLVATLATKANNSVSRINTRLSSYGSNIALHIGQKDEELDMLWWLTEGTSNSLNKPFGRLGLGVRAIVVGAELASLTRFKPGPVGVRGLIQKVCEKSATKKSTIAAAIEGCDREWLKKHLIEDADRLTPVNFAIVRRLEVKNGVDWSSSWAAICALNEKDEYSELELAYQFYSERLALERYGSQA